MHDNHTALGRILESGEPGVYFEDKILYGRQMCRGGRAGDLFDYDFLDEDGYYARAYIGDPESYDCVVIAPGGMFDRVLEAARGLLVEDEVTCQVIVPSRLYPFDLEPLVPTLARAGLVCVVEEGVAGGTWGSGVAAAIYEHLFGRLERPVALVNSADSVIPTAPHLEREVLTQASGVYRAIRDGLHA